VSGPPLGRHDVLVSDEVSGTVVVLEFVFRSDDITVWFGHRTLAVMDRENFAAWLRGGSDLVVDDLTWTTEGRTARVTIDGHRTYVLDGPTLAELVHRA
jgi:hypothetical protein